jgi:hypothetical protein
MRTNCLNHWFGESSLGDKQTERRGVGELVEPDGADGAASVV